MVNLNRVHLDNSTLKKSAHLFNGPWPFSLSLHHNLFLTSLFLRRYPASNGTHPPSWVPLVLWAWAHPLKCKQPLPCVTKVKEMHVYQWRSEYDSLEKRINLLSISIYYIDLLYGYRRLWWNGKQVVPHYQL
jgi:hypothetical protein